LPLQVSLAASVEQAFPAMFMKSPDINQAAVQQFGWLAPGQMVIGLGLA
jgi:hypothetical protein